MANLGHLFCRTCTQNTCLGIWLRDGDDRGFGFWQGGESAETLGLKALNFLAQHVDHDLLLVSSGRFDDVVPAEAIAEYEHVERRLSATWHEGDPLGPAGASDA